MAILSSGIESDLSILMKPVIKVCPFSRFIISFKLSELVLKLHLLSMILFGGTHEASLLLPHLFCEVGFFSL